MNVQLLPSIIQREKFDKEKYAALPQDVQQLAKNYPYVHKVTVIPQKKAGSGLCKTRILIPASFSSPGLVPINKGRVPEQVPPANQDDMRSCVFYILGSGTQKFRTNLQTNQNHFVEATEQF